MSFEIGSLRCVKYIEKKQTQYQPDFWAGNLQSKILKKGSEKNEYQEDLKSSFYRYYWFLSKKTKWKYGFEDSFSNFDLSLTGKQPINGWLYDTLVLLNHLDNITRNQDILVCSEISINVIFKHVEHVRIIWTEKLPGAEILK